MKQKIQAWLRRLLGVPSTVDVEAATLRAYEDTRELIRQAVMEMANRASNLKYTEDRISARFKELDKAEAQMERLAGDMTLAIYDAVEKIMAEIAEAKREIVRPRYDESKGEKPLDKE